MMVCEGITRDHVVGWVGVMSRDPSIESPVIRDGAMNEWERRRRRRESRARRVERGATAWSR